MTENRDRATKGPIRLLHECARLAGFDPARGWPGELPLKGVVNILAGAWRLSDEGRKEWSRIVSAAVKPGGGLPTIEKATTFQPATRKIGSLAGNGRFSHWATGLDPELAYTPPPETRVTYYVTRAALAAWLRAIGETTETISACALAWLGPDWQATPKLEPADSNARDARQALALPRVYPPTPGKWTRSNIRLMAKAAWQIECDNDGRLATVDEVLKRMRGWGDSGNEWELLSTDDKMPPDLPETHKKAASRGAVLWQTQGGKPQSFDREACEKALQRWRESRQQ